MSGARIDARRARLLAWIALGIYLIALGITATLRTQGDFDTYYRAGARVLGGQAIYRADESSHFLYAPIFAIAFAPFAAIPLHAAQLAWYLVSAAGLLGLIIGSSRMLFGADRRLEAALIVAPVLLSARFIDNNIEHGQINLPTLALTVWAIVFGEEDRGALSGLMLSAAILIKPFAALAALFLILEWKWRPIVFAAGFGIVLLAAPALLFGPRGALEQTVAYAQVVSSMTDRYTTMLTNQSAASAVARLMSLRATGAPASHLALYVGTGIELALVAAVLLWYAMAPDDRAGATPRPHRFQLAALFCIMPSLVPVSWKSYYAALLVPYMLLVSTLWTDRPAERKGPAPAWALVVLSVMLNSISGDRANHFALFYSAHFASSLVLLAALAVTERWSHGPAGGRISTARTMTRAP